MAGSTAIVSSLVTFTADALPDSGHGLTSIIATHAEVFRHVSAQTVYAVFLITATRSSIVERPVQGGLRRFATEGPFEALVLNSIASAAVAAELVDAKQLEPGDHLVQRLSAGAMDVNYWRAVPTRMGPSASDTAYDTITQAKTVLRSTLKRMGLRSWARFPTLLPPVMPLEWRAMASLPERMVPATVDQLWDLSDNDFARHMARRHGRGGQRGE